MLNILVQYSTEGKLKEPNLAAEAGQGLLSAVTAYARGDVGGALQSAMGFVKTATGSSAKADKYAKATKTSPADVVCISDVSFLLHHQLKPYRSRGLAVRTHKLVPMRQKLVKQQEL